MTNIVEILVRSKDETKAGSDSARANVKSIGDEADKTGSRFEGLGGKLAKVGAVAATAIAASAVGIGKALYDVGATMDEMEDKIRVGTGASGEALSGLMESAKRVGTQVPSDFNSVGDAVMMLNRHLGLTGKPLEDMASQMLNLSRITGTDLKGNIENLGKVFEAWHVEVADQPKLLDEIFRASQQSGIGVDKLAASLLSAGPQMRALGFSTEETIAYLAQFEKSGIDSDAVMGALRIGIGKVAKAHGDSAGAAQGVTKAQEALNEAMKKYAPGSAQVMAAQAKLTEAQDKAKLSTGSIRDVLDGYITKIKEAKDPSDALAIATEAFGKKGVVMADAIRSGKFNMDALIGSITNGTDTINKASLETMDFAEQWQLTKNRLMVAFQPAAAKVFAAIGDAMEQNGPKIAKMADNVGPLLVHAIETFIAAANTALPIIQVVGSVLASLGPAAGPVVLAVGGIVSAFKAVDTVKSTFDLLPAKFGEIALSAVTNFGKMGFAVAGYVATSIAGGAAATAAWVAANVAMIAATGGIILAIGAVIAIVVLVVKHWDWIKEKTKEVWDAIWGFIKASGEKIKEIVLGFINFLVNLFMNLTLAGLIIKHWDAIKRAFSEGVNACVNFVRNMISMISSAASGLGNLLVEGGRALVQGLWRGISAMGSWLKSQILGFIKSFVPGPVLKFLGIASDSKMFIQIGKFVGSGLANGILSTVGLVRRASERLSSAVPIDGQYSAFRTSATGFNAAIQQARTAVMGQLGTALKVDVTSGTPIEEFLAEIIRKYVSIQGGDVQQTLGSS